MSTRGGRRQLAATLQLKRRQPLHRSTTPATTMDILQASHGHRLTQAKSLSLGEYVFLTDNIFMFTHSLLDVGAHTFSLYHPCQFISFLCFLLVCLINLKKNPKKQLQLLISLLSMLVVVIKKKTPKYFLFFFCLSGAFPCKQFYFFSFLWGRQEKTIIKLLKWLLYALLLI